MSGGECAGVENDFDRFEPEISVDLDNDIVCIGTGASCAVRAVMALIKSAWSLLRCNVRVRQNVVSAQFANCVPPGGADRHKRKGYRGN